MQKKRGKIIPNGVYLEKHENDIVVFLTELGYDIELIPRSFKKGVKTADFRMDGHDWEMKSPKGKGKWLLDNTLHNALRQSNYIVVDLKRIGIPEGKCILRLEKQFECRKGIKQLKIITKSRKVIEFKR